MPACDLGLDPALAACLQRSLAGPHLAPGSPSAPPPMTLSAFGMNLHAATTADGRDRKQLERICRYLLRPPFAHDAVTALPGGRVRVSFKAPWRSGTAHADMDAHQFLARLCALVPPPGFHMTRYYGVLASHHRLRERVIPKPAAPPPPQLPLDFASPATRPNPRPRPRPDHDASAGQSSSPASSRSTSPAAEHVAAACASSRSSPTPTPSPASCTAPALPLRLLLPASSCCSPDHAPLR